MVGGRTAFLVEGEFGEGDWKNIGDSKVSCGAELVCSDSVAGSYEAGRAYDFYDSQDQYHPCVSQEETVYIITEYDYQTTGEYQNTFNAQTPNAQYQQEQNITV